MSKSENKHHRNFLISQEFFGSREATPGGCWILQESRSDSYEIHRKMDSHEATFVIYTGILSRGATLHRKYCEIHRNFTSRKATSD